MLRLVHTVMSCARSAYDWNIMTIIARLHVALCWYRWEGLVALSCASHAYDESFHSLVYYLHVVLSVYKLSRYLGWALAVLLATRHVCARYIQ